MNWLGLVILCPIRMIYIVFFDDASTFSGEIFDWHSIYHILVLSTRFHFSPFLEKEKGSLFGIRKE